MQFKHIILMKMICHRANMIGPNPNMENNPEYINKTLHAGYDVEIDVWLLSDGFYLGHDNPTYKINKYFLQNQKIWSHCKNLEAYMFLLKHQDINCFFQNEEEVVLTSRGYLWSHSKCKTWNNKTVITQLDSRNWKPPSFVFAVCSDYICDQCQINTLPFDLLIIDIDGVMTDGTKIYDRDGKVFGKKYCDLDFTAIKRFIAAGIKVCFLSGDQTVNKAMAETRQIDFFHNTPGVDKADMLPDIKTHYKSFKTAYVGDDYYDISIMNSVDLAFCPQTSFTPVKAAGTIINVDAGKGVIAGLYDKFEDKIAYSFPIDSANVNPK